MATSHGTSGHAAGADKAPDNASAGKAHQGSTSTAGHGTTKPAAKPHAAAARQPAHAPSHSPASERASSARERDNERFERSARRPDPSDMQRERNAKLHEEDPAKHPPVQQGLSSSELNTSHPDQKAEATEAAKDLDHNNMGGEGTQEEHDEDAKKASN